MNALDPVALFARPGRFLRGNLHTHSTRSDGALDPAEVARRYRAQGYDFLCLSDHFLDRYGFPVTDTTGLRAEGFTTLLGAELHAGRTRAGEVWHILAVGLPADFAPTGAGEDMPALAARAAAAGAFVAIAHPQWYALTLDDARGIEAAHAVEVYNHTCAVRTDRPDGTTILDGLLDAGLSPGAIATDDAHFREAHDPDSDAFGGWVMVRAADATPEAILDALRTGASYASQGPEFRAVAREGDTLVVRTTAVSGVMALGPGAKAARVAGRSITEARFDLARFSGGWLRLVAVDAAGRRAWTNALRV